MSKAAQDEEQTCGKGLAENAVLPEKISGVMQAMADLLENHVRSLARGDAKPKLEQDAYLHLVKEQRSVAGQLASLAKAMCGYRDLPSAPHDEAVLADAKSLDVFAAFVSAEENLLSLLQEQTREYRDTLSAMRA
jgi:hypothetical protein